MIISNDLLSFADYISNCRQQIAQRRVDLHHHPGTTPQQIIDANSPFEESPSLSLDATPQPYQYGALLIHGLFDCPFTMRDIAATLKQHNIYSQAILLPGHGTHPADLTHIKYMDWIKSVRYGITSLSKRAETLFIIGFSLGAILAIYHVLQYQDDIAGIVLLAPAIQVSSLIHFAMRCYRLFTWIKSAQHWMLSASEKDYTRYRSVALQAAQQVVTLTTMIQQMMPDSPFTCPQLMILSDADQTISVSAARQFFKKYATSNSKLILYQHQANTIPHDPAMITRTAHDPTLHIQHLSHICLPFSPENPHYGKHSHWHAHETSAHTVCYGDYPITRSILYDWLYQVGLSRVHYRQLTFNPDFTFMATTIVDFILSCRSST